MLGRARALLMPIRWDEPFGIVMIEAMACGTPVIGFRRGAVPEVVETGVTGFVVDTLEAMIAAITRVGAIDRAACRARVEARYGERAVTDGYLALYRALLERRARAGRLAGIA
jgi:glycosyltransferase involved in cell wall biosynthesis